MKKLLLILTCSIFCLLSASAQTQPCAVSTCIANPIITPNNFNYCPIDTLCIDSVYVINCPKTSPNSVLTISTCENSTFTYSTPLNSGSTYSWTVIGDLSNIPNNNEITISWGTQGMGVISVEETDLQGCIGNYTLQIEILATPSANYSITPTPGPYCTNSDIQFSGTNTNLNSGPPIYYFWDFGDGNFSTDQNPIHSYANSGAMNCTLVVYNECQCADTITFSVNIITGTAPEITSCINTVCEGDIVEYCTNASSPSWIIEGGVIVNSLSTDPCIQVDWNNTNGTINNGYGNIYLSDLSSTGCQSTQAFEVPIIPLTPEINGADIVCKGDKSYYSFHCIPGVEYNWNVAGGFIVNNPQPLGSSYPTSISGVCEIAVEWNNSYYTTSGTVSLTLSSSILDCSPISASKQISILNRINMGGDDEVCFNTNHTYVVATNPNNEQLVWEITNGVDLFTQTTTTTATQTTVQWNQNAGVGVITATPVNNGVWCEPIATFVVDISENPLPPSSIDGPTTICPNSTYQYSANPSNSTSPDNLTYQWTIAGGMPATTTGNSANITWAATGPYSITIKNIMNDSPFCDSQSLTTTIYPQPSITPIITTNNQNPCINTITNFSVTDNGNTIPVDAEITWTVSDPSTPGTSIYGSVVSGQGTNYMEIEWGNLFNPVGQAITVEVEVKQCNVSYTQTIQINLSDPDVSFTFIHNNASYNSCTGIPISFSATITNSMPGNYSWDFGDGTTGSGQNTTHTYSLGGYYQTTVTFTSSSGCTSSFQQGVYVLSYFNGSLSFDKPDNNNVISTCPPNAIDVNITLITTGSINTITWTDPNGFVLLTGNPNTTPSVLSYNVLCTAPNYSCMGVYTVTLLDAYNCSKVLTFEVDTSCGSGGNCRPCEPMQVSSLTCYSGKFNAQFFSPNYPNPNYPQTSNQQWLSQQNSTALDFSYGNGSTTNNVLNPSHDYSIAGVFNVYSYEVGHLYDCAYLIGCATVTIPFVVDWNSISMCDPNNNNQLSYHFYDNTSYYMGSGPFIMLWDFGDGTSSTTTNTGQGQDHVYATAGPKTVTLTITAATGEVCSLTQTINVIDINGLINAVPPPFCEDVPTVSFSSTLSTAVSWDWNFGDGAGSSLAAPQRTYSNPGTYNVQVDVTLSNSCNISFNLPITVNPTPEIQATSPPNYCTGTSPDDLTTYATATGNTISWSGNGVVQTGSTWFFDPNIAGEGTHQICAIETNQFGCFDDTCFSISVFCAEQPKIFGESQFCQDSDTYLNLSTQAGFSNYEWKKNNTIISNATTSTYIDYGFIAYAVGTYTYEVTFTDNNGCISTSDLFEVVRNPLPNPFSITPNNTLCAGSQVTLTHNGTEVKVDYVWNTIPAQTSQSVTILPEYNLLYVVVAINEYGCLRSSNTIEVAEEILVCNILSGCYCDTILLNANGEIEIPGMANYSSYTTSPAEYKWVLTTPSNTITLSTNQNLIIGPGDPYYQDIFNGEITLSVTDIYACTASSDPLLIEQCSTCDLAVDTIILVCDSCCYFKYELATGGNTSNLQWHLSELTPPPLGVSIILEQYPPGTFSNNTTYIDSFLVCSDNELQFTISNFGFSLSGVTFKGWLCDELVVNLDTTTNTQYIEMIPASNLNAHLEANVSGGNGSYTYSWTGPNGFTASTQEIIGVGDGEYCVVVSDGTGTLCGDINSDGSINTLDITAITNMIMNGQYSIEADVNCDGNVNIIDLTLINNFISTGNPLNCCIDTTCIDTFCVTVSCSSCPIECQADSALNISTGYDNANQTLYPTTNAPGFISTDPNWILVASPDPNVNLNGPANVIAPISVWNNIGNAGWISPYFDDANGTNVQLQGGIIVDTSYTFRNCFCMCQGDSVTIDLLMSADNYAEISLLSDFQTTNEVLTNIGQLPGLGAIFNQFNFLNVTPFLYTTYLEAGKHCLVAELYNQDVSLSTGLKIEGYVTSQSGIAVEDYTCCDPTIYISGTKYIDSNCDSIGDSYGSGWTIYLYDDNHNIIDSAITDINGYYSFAIPADSFPNGNFYVGEVAQSGYTAYNGHDEFYLTGLGQNGSQSVTVDFLNCVCINTTGTSAIDTCDSYTWNGLAITVSGNYTQTFTNVAGCDSVHTLVVTIDYANTGTSYITACDSSSWNGQLITASGDYTQIFTNVAGCDSVHTLFVIINNSDSVSSIIDTCDSYTWNGIVISTSGNYTQTFTNAAGCDSVHTLVVTISYANTGTSSITACDSYLWNGQLISTSGVYTQTFTNVDGCDSVHTLIATIDSSTTSYFNVTSCDDYVWNGTTYTTSGTYTYTYNGNVNSAQVGIDIDGEAADDNSGYSVSFSSNGLTVAIGARYNDGNGANAGHVRLYSWNGTSWLQLGSDIDGEAAGDQSGWSVSLSSDGLTVAIGALYNDGNGTNAGHVRLYSWNGTSWLQLGSDIDGEATGDQSGYSVSLSSDGLTVAIGAQHNNGNGAISGHVRLYSWNGIAWLQIGSDIDGEAAGDRSGHSVSLSSDGLNVAIGAYYNNGNGSQSGHVRLYSWNGTSWLQLGSDIDGEAAGDYSGYSVSLSDGLTVAIGARYNDGGGFLSGHVRLYIWNGTSWLQLGADINGESAYDQSGSSVSLSSDGSTVAIGAWSNNGNGGASGHVRLYTWNGTSWLQLGCDIDGEAAGDYSGWSVSLSDSLTVAIGAIYNDGNGYRSGHVRVYTPLHCGCDSTVTLNLSLSNLEVMITDTCRGINNSTSVDDIYVTINGGTAPYTYTWSVSILGIQIPFSTITSNQPYTSLIGVSDGDYCLSITDANGCILDTCIVANCHCCLVITDVVDTCLVGGGDLEISVFGGNSSNSYTYTWTSPVFSNIPSSNHISNLPNGVYYLHVEEDSSHCFLDTTFVVNCPCNLILSATDTCFYDANTASNLGDINLTVSGGSGSYTYDWTATNGFTASTQNISNLILGPTYCVIVTDLNDPSCTDTLCIEISNNSCLLPCFTLSASDTCIPGPVWGQDYGAIDLTVTGNSLFYSYYWTGPNGYTSVLEDITGLANGIYTVAVSDPNYPNCPNTWLSVTISCNTSPVCSLRTTTGLSVTDLTHDRAKVNWSDANTSLCLVEMYRVQYRELGTTAWSTKTALGSGLCNFGLTTTSKMLWNLTPSTIYEYRVKAWYCLSSASAWSSISTFTTEDVCANILNLSVSSASNTQATFTWVAPSTFYSFVRIKLRVDTLSSAWFTAGGFGVMYPALTRNKNGLTPGQSYRASSRTWCNPSGGAHKALSWTPFVFWTQPGTLIRIEDESSTAITDLEVYPNPSRDIFNVSFISEDKQTIEVRVLNTIGEIVFIDNRIDFIGEYSHQFNLKDYSKGIYFLEIKTENGFVNKKLILQ